MDHLPVTEMVLYKHGVGFFVRHGTFNGESVVLDFRQTEINDVLKSLAVVDEKGGQILGIDYQTPMDQFSRLESTSIRLSDEASLRDLIRDLRGRLCTIQYEPVLGTIESINGRMIGSDQQTEHPDKSLVVMLTPTGVKAFNFYQIRAIDIHDTQSKQDLSYFLDSSMVEDERRRVTVRLTEGNHDLSVYYVAPSPTWRVSYRLIGFSETDHNKGKASLQGWGLFDNRLDEDLKNVKITLVAGQPISFIYGLYHSNIPNRPYIEDESRVAPGPIEFERSITMPDSDYDDSFDLHDRGVMGGMMPPAPASMMAASARMMKSTPPSFKADTTTKSSGETFQYIVNTPVSVKRGESALVPIIQHEIPYERELLYSKIKFPNHPVAALSFENITGLTLERGPITVIEDGDYRGDAIIPFTPDKKSIYLPFAVELGIKISEDEDEQRIIAGMVIRDGVLFEQIYHVSERIVTLRNSTQKDQVVTVEIAIMSGWQLFDTATPDYHVDHEYRWKVFVGSQNQARFICKSRYLQYERREISDLHDEQLQRYLNNRYIDEQLYQDLHEILATMQIVKNTQKYIGEITEERKQLYVKQEQLRANLGSLQAVGQEANLRNRLLGQLESSQNRLEAIEQEIIESRQAIENGKQRYQELVAMLKPTN